MSKLLTKLAHSSITTDKLKEVRKLIKNSEYFCYKEFKYILPLSLKDKDNPMNEWAEIQVRYGRAMWNSRVKE